MTEEVKKKPGRKPKTVVEKIEKVETPVIEEKVETPVNTTPESPVEAPNELSINPEGDGTTGSAIAPESPVEAPNELPVLDTVTIEIGEGDITPVETVKEITQSFIAALADEVQAENSVELEEDFKPILRPTNVAGNPIGHMPCPRLIFDLVTTDPDWQSKIESSQAKVGLKSVKYWLEKNGELKVRCMSSSKFGDVLK